MNNHIEYIFKKSTHFYEYFILNGSLAQLESVHSEPNHITRTVTKAIKVRVSAAGSAHHIPCMLMGKKKFEKMGKIMGLWLSVQTQFKPT